MFFYKKNIISENREKICRNVLIELNPNCAKNSKTLNYFHLISGCCHIKSLFLGILTDSQILFDADQKPLKPREETSIANNNLTWPVRFIRPQVACCTLLYN